MNWLIWPGATLSLVGVALLLWCIVAAARARKENLDDTALKQRLQSLVAWNMGALALSTLGLMMVVMGIALG